MSHCIYRSILFRCYTPKFRVGDRCRRDAKRPLHRRRHQQLTSSSPIDHPSPHNAAQYPDSATTMQYLSTHQHKHTEQNLYAEKVTYGDVQTNASKTHDRSQHHSSKHTQLIAPFTQFGTTSNPTSPTYKNSTSPANSRRHASTNLGSPQKSYAYPAANNELTTYVETNQPAPENTGNTGNYKNRQNNSANLSITHISTT